ncbi:hypothetical protein C8J57DRAFT_214526 [Mycena rebaudengoi]|nr:hypothetical protein C8J57DRAFT_214526 [Mycena rebaudengoi]
MFPGTARHRMHARSLLTGVYQANWRIFVICITSVNALRFFLFATSALEDLKIDIAQNNPRLAGVSRILAVIYTLSCAIELFGVFCAVLHRAPLVRIYAYLAALSALLVTSAGIITTAAYFAFADELVNECVALAVEGNLDLKSTFRGAPWSISLSPAEAQTQCLALWSTECTSQLLAPALFYLLPAALRVLLAYGYARQLADPAHPAHTHSNAIRMEYRAVPRSPGDAETEGSGKGKGNEPGNGNQNAHRPPAGKRRLTVSPRSYRPSGAVVSLANGSFEPSSQSLSPGPPSFSGVEGMSTAYNGLPPRFSAGSENDAFI